jgi:enoyl-CoA hydratase/carnithine racemase
VLENDHGEIRELRLNRPPVNALSPDLMAALAQAVTAAPRQGIRALVLSGAPGIFSAGLDLPLLLTLDRAAIADAWRTLYALMRALAASPVPMAAAMTGHAPAGGTVLPLFCDWRVMADGAWKVGVSEVQVGLMLPPVILAALQRVVGVRRAEFLAVGGDLVDPPAALRLGLVDEVIAPEAVVGRALEWCKARLALPREAMISTRRQARADLIALFERDLSGELEQVSEMWWGGEAQAAMRAVVERLKQKRSAASGSPSLQQA